MRKFVRNLLTEWRKLKLPFEDATILIAVSGGADSVSLTFALHELKKAEKLNLNFVIGHFNHNLRGDESRKDAEFVEDLAKNLKLKFIGGIQNSNLKNQKGNLEQLARYARYEFLDETAISLNACGVLTAHTLNDQAETFLMRLIRGSGADGLSAMKSISEIPNTHPKSKIQNPKSKIPLFRPFLSWVKREDTENFCVENKLLFRRDEMNEDFDFLRVRVRKELLPLLKSYNPKIINRISTTAFQLQEDSEQLNFEAKKILEKSKCESEKIIKFKYLAESSKSLRQRAIRLWILENNFNLRQIKSKHFEAIESLIFSKKSGRIIELPDGKIIIKKDGKLFFEISKVEKS